ncbi:hypothetical protein Q8F55_004137 [Vanrija albida]|uniref:Protein kinase domain-containing protein n=1 Tax=Vanrija albida TaxID=181172 RepID=A0ABR3Q5Y5_9TREE
MSTPIAEGAAPTPGGAPRAVPPTAAVAAASPVAAAPNAAAAAAAVASVGLLAPEAVMLHPPTPIDAAPGSGIASILVNPSTIGTHTIEEEPEELHYDSPEEEWQDSAVAAARRPLNPYSKPVRGHSTPIPTSSSMSSQNTVKGSGDDMSLANSPQSMLGTSLPSPSRSAASISPSHLASSSPHLFEAPKRAPSPSSPDYRNILRSSRQNSTHRVRETTLGSQHSTLDGARVVNQYKLGHTLGKGAFATVYSSLDVGTGEEYAVKEFSKSRLQNRMLHERQMKQQRERRRRPARPGAPNVPPPRPALSRSTTIDEEALKNDPLALIRREIAVMMKLDHPNLIKLYESISVPSSDSLFLVLEYGAGGVLMNIEPGADATNAKPAFPFDMTREYFRQLVLSLEYLHHNGVTHRDIKPENILFSKDRDLVKLADFGVSEMFEAKTNDDRIRTQGGSPAFLSPEAFTASTSTAVHGRPVDIWALGVTLYCMLTGTLPWNTAHPAELYTRVTTEEPKIYDEWPPELKELVTGMLTKDPAKRFTIPDIRANQWVTNFGTRPLVDVEENLYYWGKEVVEPTIEEIKKAITSLRSLFTVVRAVNKMRRLQSMSMSSQTRAGSMSTQLPIPSDMSGTSGSMDSYAVSVTTGATTPDVSGSPKVDFEPGLPSNRAFSGLPPIDTGARPPIFSDEPSTMGSPIEGEFVGSPVDMVSSPIQVDSPLECESPIEVAGVADMIVASPEGEEIELVASPEGEEIELVASPEGEEIELVESPSAV